MDGFARYLLARLLRAVLTIACVVSLVFLLVHAIPGDPVQAILGDQASPEDRAALRSSSRLDRPLPEQYGLFLGDLASGTLGPRSRAQTRTVASLVRSRPPDFPSYA